MHSRYQDDDARRKGYQNERTQRWGLEAALLNPVADLICNVIRSDLGHPAQYEKYAEPLINAFLSTHPGKDVPGSIRGAPDLKISVGDRIWYVELKIKRERYRNTRNGSKTVRAYGCESHYLDDYPVYQNVLAHATAYSIRLHDIVLLYAVNQAAKVGMPTPLAPKEWQFECMKLDELKRNVEADRYQLYGQGYGQRAWLLRCDDLQDIARTFI